jgi:outer membrane protein TolC
MKPSYSTLLFLLVIPLMGIAQGQETATKPLTLEECVNYALENSISLKNALLDENIADAKVKETRGIGLPQVDGKVSLQHNQKLPRFYATKQTAFGFSGLPSEEYPNFLPTLADDDIVAAQNFFQLKSSGDAGLRVDQLLFNSSYLVGLRAANTYRELSVRTTQQTREEIVQNVSKAYYACLINKDRTRLFDSNIARIDSLYRNTKALFENGFAESIDADRIKVSLNNVISERDKFYNLQELTIQILKFQMNYPMNQPLEVGGDISGVAVDANLLSHYGADWDYSQRTDYAILETNQRLLSLDVKNKFSESLPSLSAFANLGYSTQSGTIGGIFSTNSKFDDTGTIGPDKWYPYSSFGVTVNVPIFSGLQRSYKLQQAKLELMKIENSFTTLKSSIDLEIKEASVNYKNAIQSLNSQRENNTLAENVARITKIKYEQGVGSNIEVVDAENSLREAQTNFYNALYDAVVAKIDLDRAYGRLIQNLNQE